MKLLFVNMTVELITFNMDEHTTNSLKKVNMIYNIHTDTISFAIVKSAFEQIFEDELKFLD